MTTGGAARGSKNVGVTAPDRSLPIADQGGDPACWAHLFEDADDDDSTSPASSSERR